MSKTQENKAQMVEAVKAECAAQYENGWCDLVVETMEDSEIAEVIGNATTVKGAMKKLKAHVGGTAEARAEAIAAGGEEVPALYAQPEQPLDGTSKWVVKVTGAGMGRSRYVMEDGTLDPWKFHARQFATRQEAESWMFSLSLDGQLTVAKFAKAWHEPIPAKYAK
jgi:ribosomal protein L12E/L44/L45/RPP1/RPP2